MNKYETGAYVKINNLTNMNIKNDFYQFSMCVAR